MFSRTGGLSRKLSTMIISASDKCLQQTRYLKYKYFVTFNADHIHISEQKENSVQNLRTFTVKKNINVH